MSIRIAPFRCGCPLLLALTLLAWCETRSLGDDAADAEEPAAEIESADEPGGGDDAASLERLRNQTTSYRQTGIIRATTEHYSALESFVIAPDGRILALVQLNVPGEDETAGSSILSIFGASKGKKSADEKPAVPACEVRIFSPQGKHDRLAAWPVSFMAQTLGLGPDNRLYVAGSGRVARYSLDGSELAIADSPQVTLIEHDRDALRQAAEAQIEEEKENAKQTIAQFEPQRAAIAAEIEKTSDKAKLAQLKAQLKQYDRLIHQTKQLLPKARTVEEVMVEITERVKRINAIAASDTEVFITCPQTKGYGYSVWRTDLEFANPKCIVTGLSGCCGQMDVCCAEGGLWVAENSRHRVVRYDREGKRLAAFGKTGRDGVGASFGGCCNPMNLCFDKAGDLLVSESNGQVKHFTAKGKFVEVTGVARVEPGCKNSAVKVSPDGEQVYYIDVHKSQILILARNKADASASN